jgi:predicted AlkP superfamily phosphohydrolase/phosphomutase
VIVIGLDGLDPGLVEGLLSAGELPNLAKLRAQGGLARVATTCPAQTPVAWATFATGVNPGGHGIFDFLRRDPQTYLPDLALNRYEQKNAFLPPRAVNLRRGTPIWERLAEAGIAATVLRCPCTYPPDNLRGRMLSGMGTPDLRGGLGSSTFYTSDVNVEPGESERIVFVHTNDSKITTNLIGPWHPRTHADLQASMMVEIDRASRRVVIRVEGSARALEVAKGHWSEWLPVKFCAGLLQTIRGLVRFYLVRLEPELALYASPIQFDPAAPLFPISTPPDYAAELSERIGPFATAGMIEDHTGLSNGRLDEEAFLDQCEDVWHQRTAMMLHELERFDEGFFYCLFDTPDRVQHMLWRHRELDHPANFGRPRPDLACALDDQYRRADSVLGQALAHGDDQTLVIVLSDHGFSSFQRCVDLNKWLYEQDLLALRADCSPGAGACDLLRGVDWSRTKAYALGLSGVFLNLEGREAQGIVKPADATPLKTAISRALCGLPDPERGEVAIRNVKAREDVYRGQYVGDAPDLLVQFARGYRVSWSTSLGGVSETVFADNVRAWSGDHIIDPALVPGVLLMNRPFGGEGARLVDLAPTILSAFGLPPCPALEGSSLLP